MSISRLMQRASAGVAVSGDSNFLVPLGTRHSTNGDYIIFLNSSGSFVGAYNVGSAGTLDGCQYYRYGDYMYVFTHYSGTAWHKIDLTDFSQAAVGNINSDVGRGWFSPISDSQLIRVSAANSQYYIFDMSTGTETAYSYTAGTTTGIAQTHGTLTFYDYTSTGVANVSDQIWWTAARAGASSYPAEVNYATLTGTTLGSYTSIYDGVNYSRNHALTVDSDKGLIWIFDSQMHTVVPSTSTYTAISPQSFTDTYTYSFDGLNSYRARGKIGVSATGNIYGNWLANDGTKYIHKVCLFDPFSSTTPTPTVVYTFDGTADADFPNGVITPLNEAGYVYVAYFDYATDFTTIKIAILNGSSQVGSTITTNISSTYSDTNVGTSLVSPHTQSYLGPILAGSAT